MDPIVNKITEHVSEQSLQPGVGAPTQEVDSADQMQFENALNGQGVEGVQDVQTTQSNLEIGQQEMHVGKPTLGDAILNGIEKLKSNHDVRAERIEKAIVDSKGELTMEDMMKLQFEVMQLGIEQDITTKMADKTSSGVQTLFRNQG